MPVDHVLLDPVAQNAGDTHDVRPEVLYLYRQTVHTEILAAGDFYIWNDTAKRLERGQLASADGSVVITPTAGTPDKLDLSAKVPKVSYLTTAKHIVAANGVTPANHATFDTTYDPTANIASLQSVNGLAAGVTSGNVLEWMYLAQVRILTPDGTTSTARIYNSLLPPTFYNLLNVATDDASGFGGLAAIVCAAANAAAVSFSTQASHYRTPNASSTHRIRVIYGTGDFAIDLLGCLYA